jgi:hypothetical protein
MLRSIVILAFLGLPLSASTLKISAGASTRQTATEVEANYASAHVFIDETAGESVPFTIFFDPQTFAVQSCEVFTNLNRRERADDDANGDGVHDGIVPPPNVPSGSDAHYFKAHPMSLVAGGYQLTLNATKTGAYRLTVRWRLNTDPAGSYRYYNNDDGGGKRDYAIVVSPKKARDIIMYEVNPLTIIATGISAAQRGTFADLANGVTGGPGTPRFSLDYVKDLGANTLWFQPFHPNGIVGRQIDPETGAAFEVGSPYAVKNFFEVMPLMAKAFTPGGTPATNDTPGGRAQAMAEFQTFAAAADAENVDIMVDAPFNHTSYDVELAPLGQSFWGNAGSNASSEIRNVEARFFSRSGAYDMRASSAGNIAIAPDRIAEFAFGDTYEVYFGRYAALTSGSTGGHLNEGDWFDYSIGSDGAAGGGNGHFDSITQNVWRYFAGYIDYWLTQSGYPANAGGASLATSAGIDGLRADFGQGLPPQAWEYIINRTRSRKWNFVFMAESLDGGPVTYRSSRHFDILNENIVFPLHEATTTSAFRSIYEIRRNSYGQAGVLLNTSSHDEDHYNDPWQALIRYAVNSTIDGAPLIFPGQELGLSGTIVPPNHTNGTSAYGYERYEINFGKPIPHFKKYNSLMPLWRQTDPAHPNYNFGIAQLHPVFAAIGKARAASPALRSSNRYFLDPLSGGTNQNIFSVAKYELPNASPAVNDVVFGFVNLDRNNSRSGTFNVNVSQSGSNLFGIKPGRTYNLRNLSAYTALNPNRDKALLWGTGKTGAEILANGVFAELNAVPMTNSAWTSSPFEAQYLKLLDTTAPTTALAQPQGPNVFGYAIGNQVTFTWPPASADAEGVVPSYRVNISIDGSAAATAVVNSASYTVNSVEGKNIAITVQAVNPNDPAQSGPISPVSLTVKLLNASSDEDGDGQNNAAEHSAGMNPLNANSVFKITSTARPTSTSVSITWASAPGKAYEVWATSSLDIPFTKISGLTPIASAGVSTSFTDTSADGNAKFYQIRTAP